MMRVVVREWHWCVLASNGQVLLTSEEYASKTNALRAAIKFAFAAAAGRDISPNVRVQKRDRMRWKDCLVKR